MRTPNEHAPARNPLLLLIRHGQSEWNAVRRWQGLADSPLTERGRAQAAEAAGSLARSAAEFAAVWSSDLRRASETASIIGAVLGTGEVHLDPRLREADAGPWQGFTPDEIEQRWPGWLAAHRRPEGFEPAESVVERAMAACTDLLRDHHGRPVVAVTHSGLIRALRRHLGAADDRVANLGGAWIGLDAHERLRVAGSFAPGSGTAVDTTGFSEDPGDESRHNPTAG